MLLFINKRFLAFQWIDGCYKTEVVSKKKKMQKKRIC